MTIVLLRRTRRDLILPILLLSVVPVHGRTINLDASRCNRMALISAAAPMHGWASKSGHRCCWTGTEPRRSHGWHPGWRWNSTLVNDLIRIDRGHSFLLSFPLDMIPKGHRVVHAQLTLPVTYAQEHEPRFYVWRVLPDWGPGVCHLYRSTRPQRVAWNRPGAAGLSSDRATRPTDIVRLSPATMQLLDRGRWSLWSNDMVRDLTVNVTEDVDLWHSGAAANNGWLITVEDPGTYVEMLSPVWDGRNRWKLRITYEPQPQEP